MTGKENALASSPVRSLQIAPVAPKTPAVQQPGKVCGVEAAAKDFSFPAIGTRDGAARPQPTQDAANQAGQRFKSVTKPLRQPNFDSPPGPRPNPSSQTPAAKLSSNRAPGHTPVRTPLGDASNIYQWSPPQPGGSFQYPQPQPLNQPQMPPLAPSTPPEQVKPRPRQRIPACPPGFQSPGVPYNSYQLPVQPMHPPYTPHPMYYDPSGRFIGISPLDHNQPPMGPIFDHSYQPMPPNQPFPHSSHGQFHSGFSPMHPGCGSINQNVNYHSYASPPATPPLQHMQHTPITFGSWDPRELWTTPLLGYNPFTAASPLTCSSLSQDSLWSPELGVSWPWYTPAHPFHHSQLQSGWLYPRPTPGMNIRKMASICFQASSKGTKASLSKSEIKALVDHQLKAHEPVHAPWYRRGPATPKQLAPGRLLEDTSSLSSESGTGVWFPKS